MLRYWVGYDTENFRRDLSAIADFGGTKAGFVKCTNGSKIKGLTNCGLGNIMVYKNI